MKNKKLLSIIGAFGLGVTTIPFYTGIANANSVIEELPQIEGILNQESSSMIVNNNFQNSIIVNNKIISTEKDSQGNDVINIFNEDGSIFVQLTIPSSICIEVVEDIEIMDDGILVLGSRETSYSGPERKLVKMSLDGSSLLWVYWDFSDNFISNIEVLDDSTILCYGNGGKIVKINQNGSKIGEFPQPTTISFEYDDNGCIYMNSNNELFLIGGHNNTLKIVKYDLDTQSILFEKELILNISYPSIEISKDRIYILNSDPIFNIPTPPDEKNLYILDTNGNHLETLTDIDNFRLSPSETIFIAKDKELREYNKNGELITEITLPFSYVNNSNNILINKDNSISITNGNEIFTYTVEKPEPKYKGTNSLAVGVPVPNSLEMTMDTNTIDFTGYDGVSDTTNDTLSITVKSGLNYDLSATLTDEIRHSDGVTTMDKSHLRIKTSDDSDYKEFTDIGTPVTIVNNKQYGEHKHNINFKLIADSAVKAGDYEASVKFEVTQK